MEFKILFGNIDSFLLCNFSKCIYTFLFFLFIFSFKAISVYLLFQ
jgi:hypothetical protein